MIYLKKLDKLVIAVTCLTVVISFYLVFLPVDNKILVIYSNNERFEYPLEDNEFLVENSRGSLRVKIRDGRVGVFEPSCQDKWCTDSGWISRSGDSVVCLPAHIFLTIQQENTGRSGEIDTITR
jgi:hypothetical protein